jgi:hypothetical protein
MILESTGNEYCIKRFCGKNLIGEDHFDNLSVDWMIVLKFMLEKLGVILWIIFIRQSRRGSSVGTANYCGLVDSVIEPGVSGIFRAVQTDHEAYPAFCTMGSGSLSRS